jgi:antitoxin (DNA-binding transcriptional repressor) of toxin-antitoxin stability system
MPSTRREERRIIHCMIVTTEIGTAHLAELVKQVQEGNEVLLTQGNKPVARLVSARGADVKNGTPLRVRSLKGHQVLAPLISQEELSDEMFGRQ